MEPLLSLVQLTSVIFLLAIESSVPGEITVSGAVWMLVLSCVTTLFVSTGVCVSSVPVEDVHPDNARAADSGNNNHLLFMIPKTFLRVRVGSSTGLPKNSSFITGCKDFHRLKCTLKSPKNVDRRPHKLLLHG